MTAEGSNSLYHKYTMISAGDDGIIFNMYGQDNFMRYKCEDSGGWAFTSASVTINNDAGVLTGAQEDLSTTTITNTDLTLIQPREDPDNYVSGTQLQIYGIHGSGYIIKFSYAADVMTATESITVPIDHLITVSTEHLDVGNKFIALLSATQCDSDYNVNEIANASVYFYEISAATWSCRDLTYL